MKSLLVFVDLENDLLFPTRKHPGDFLSCRWSFDRLEQFRDAVSTRLGQPALFHWFWKLDPEVAHVWGEAAEPVCRYRADATRTRAAGDAHGVHPHAHRPLSDEGECCIDHRDEWVVHCLDVSLDAFAHAFAEECRYVRYGDGFWSTALTRRMIARGIRFDATIEPNRRGCPTRRTDHESYGYIGDRNGAPPIPYRPNLANVLTQGDAPIWMLPLSTARVRFNGVTEVRQLLPAFPPEVFTEQLRQHTGRDYVSVAINSRAGLNHDWRSNVEQNLRVLLDFAESGGYRFATGEQAVLE